MVASLLRMPSFNLNYSVLKSSVPILLLYLTIFSVGESTRFHFQKAECYNLHKPRANFLILGCIIGSKFAARVLTSSYRPMYTALFKLSCASLRGYLTLYMHAYQLLLTVR